MTNIVVANILLEEACLPAEAMLMRALRDRHPEVPWASRGHASNYSTDDPMFIRVGDRLTTFFMTPEPVPFGEQLAQRALWVWPDAPHAIGRHRVHLVVAAMDSTEDNAETPPPGFTEKAQLLTAVVGAMVATLQGVVAVIWRGNVARSPEMWLERSREAFSAYPDQPFALWTEIVPYRSGKTIGAFTAGVSAFAGREIEFEVDGLDQGTVAARVAQLAAYLIGNGLDEEFASGRVFEAGREINHRVAVLHRSSRFDIGPVVSFTSVDDRSRRTRTYPIIPAAIAHHHPLLVMLGKVGLFDPAGAENQIMLKPDHYESDVRLDSFDRGLSQALSDMIATDAYAEADANARRALASGNKASARSILQPWADQVGRLQTTTKFGLIMCDVFLFMPALPRGP